MLFIGMCVHAQTQFGTWRTNPGNTNYHQFVREGNGAAVYINQTSSGSNHPILRLSSGTANPNENIRLTVENSGNVGIGLTDPISQLSIKAGTNGTHYYNGLGIWSSVDVSKIRASLSATSDDSGILSLYTSETNAAVSIKSSGSSYFTGGKIGIGTTSPTHNLQIASQNHDDIFSLKRNNSTFGNIFDFRITGNPNGGNGLNPRSLTIMANEFAGDIAFLTDPSVNIPQFIFNQNGSFLIGTQSSGSHKLAVEGSIGAREIIVEASGWSDFVFESDYKLLTLAEVEKHILEKGHLPEIPSAAEVTENGISLGEMNAKLLQKIEELTLHLIEMDKKLTEQHKIIEGLRDEKPNQN